MKTYCVICDKFNNQENKPKAWDLNQELTRKNDKNTLIYFQNCFPIKMYVSNRYIQINLNLYNFNCTINDPRLTFLFLVLYSITEHQDSWYLKEMFNNLKLWALKIYCLGMKYQLKYTVPMTYHLKSKEITWLLILKIDTFVNIVQMSIFN